MKFINELYNICLSITNPLLQPVIKFVNLSIDVIDFLFISNFVKNVSLLEAMIISDGVYNGLLFTKEYIYYKIKSNVIVKNKVIIDIKKELLNNYKNLYKLDIIDRYITYLILYFMYKFIITILLSWEITFKYSQYINNICYMMFLLLVLPYIQNTIVTTKPMNKYISYYLRNKDIFIKYSISKIIINFIKNLDNRINFIKNSQIFILYRYISYNLVISFIKSYCIIYLLYLLRNNGSTYYYYKMIKMAYYYTTGHLFNQITIEESINIINIIVIEKKWYDLSNIEFVHAFYILINNKYNNDDNIYVTFGLYLSKFFTLWNFICLLKILKIQIITVLLFIYFLIDYKLNKENNKANRIEMVSMGILLYILLLSNVNELIVSTIIVLYKFIYLMFLELVFFINNINDIIKVLNYYEKQKPKLIEKIKKENNYIQDKDD